MPLVYSVIMASFDWMPNRLLFGKLEWEDEDNNALEDSLGQ